MKRDENTFYCFSPPVMIATFIIEVSLAVYTLWRYKLTVISRLVALILLFLATFQLAEYMVCQGAYGNALAWSRIGYVAITFLPPLGLHLAQAITEAKSRWLVWAAYATAAAFAAFFLLVGGAINGHACLGNYVIFQVAHNSGALFGLYYYGLLLLVLGTGWYYFRRTKEPARRRALGGLLIGYLVFIVPTVAVNLMNPNTVRGIPSIMCGFAVLLAVTLAFTVLPATVQRKKT
jgi:hypothetical protein